MTHLKTVYNWMTRESSDDTTYNVFANIIFAISGILFATLLAPEVLTIILGKNLYLSAIWAILIIMMSVGIFTLSQIYKILKGRDLLSAKYKLALSILSIPAVIFIHKIVLVYIKPLFNENGRPDKINN